MKKGIIVLCCIVFYFDISFCQIKEINFSSGVLLSDIRLSKDRRESEQRRGANDNSLKIGYISNIDLSTHIYEWLEVHSGFSYQERLPLEIFTFESNGSINAGVSTTTLITEYPTSPQSKLWSSSPMIRFPNFKYLFFEVIPVVSFGEKVNFELGVGLFYGYILNHKKLIFDESYFPIYDFLFEEPFYLEGQDSYRKHDFGWIPKLNIGVKINNKLNIGLSNKIYLSELGLKLNEHTNIFNRRLNTTWIVYTSAVNLKYRIE